MALICSVTLPRESQLKIAVCVKRVIDMETRFRIAGDGVSVDDGGAKYDINDFDLYAVEAALQLKEKAGQGEVVAVSLGPVAVQETIRKALSMGADAGLHLDAPRVPFDSLAIARALATALKDRGFDAILLGRKSIDSANESVGPMLAELLDLPCVTSISALEMDGSKGRAGRAIEGGQEKIEFSLPAVLTIDEGLNQPRLPNLKGIMAAKKKPLESIPAQLGEETISLAKMELPPDRPAGRIIGEGAAAVPELIRLLQTEAKVL
jgi:electron transfer flavoprotein beta subunit